MRKRIAGSSLVVSPLVVAGSVVVASLFTALPALAQSTPAPDSVTGAPTTPSSSAPGPALDQSHAPTEPQGSTPPASSSSPSASSGVQLSTLKMMLDKGVISQAEYDSAIGDLKESVGSTIAPDASTVMFGKWATTFYGFVEADYAYDSTESFTEFPANGKVARAGTYAGDHGRSQISIRNTRLGFRMKAPEYHGIRASAQIEGDFLGNQPATGFNGDGATPSTVTENNFFNNPTFRVRHANLRLETPVVDILFGQYWELFGWQSVYHPNTVEIQGVPGQVYSRTAQLRISKTIKTEPLNFEIAVAALRPPQRDSALPEGQAGIRLSSDKWTGYHTSGSTGSAIQPISIAVTGDMRGYSVQDFTTATNTKGYANKTTSAIAIDAYIPILHADKDHKGNSFGIYGEFVTGYGDADVYSGLNAGLANAQRPTTTNGVTTNAAYTSNVDPGLVVIDNAGGLHAVQYTTGYVGAEYYLPGLDGKYWVSGNYSHLTSANAHYYTGGKTSGYAAPTAVISDTDWFDVNLFGDITPAVRLGLEYANFNNQYIDGTHAINHRIQLSAFYIF